MYSYEKVHPEDSEQLLGADSERVVVNRPLSRVHRWTAIALVLGLVSSLSLNVWWMLGQREGHLDPDAAMAKQRSPYSTFGIWKGSRIV